jgi:hypothetical protein
MMGDGHNGERFPGPSPPSRHTKFIISEKYSNKLYVLDDSGVLNYTITLPDNILPEGISGVDYDILTNHLMLTAPSLNGVLETTLMGYVIRTVDVGFPPDDIALNPSTHVMFLSHQNRDTINCFSYSGSPVPSYTIEPGTIDNRLGMTKTSALAFNPTETHLLWTSSKHAAYEISMFPIHLENIKPLKIGDIAGPCAMDTESGLLYILDRGDIPHIIVLDAELNFIRAMNISLLKRPTIDIQPAIIAYHPGEHNLLVCDEERLRFAMLEADTGHVTRIVNGDMWLNQILRMRPPQAATIYSGTASSILLFRIAGYTVSADNIPGPFTVLGRSNVAVPTADIASDMHDALFQVPYRSRFVQRFDISPGLHLKRQAFINTESGQVPGMSGIAYSSADESLYLVKDNHEVVKYRVEVPLATDNVWTQYE